MAALALTLLGGPLRAQQGDGAIQGTITDKSGALIPNAAVVVTNIDTAVHLTRTTNKAGDFNVTPLQAGHYYVEVVAKGFQKLIQEDVTVDSLQTVGLNLKLTVGSATETITITDAPPMLDTQDASLGGTIENELYTDLPLSMGGAPRDPTAFAFLMPGVQEGAGSTGVYGGSGQEFLNQSYIDGMPVSSISAQGDPTPVRNAVSVDAVDQFQVKTNGASVAFGGAGVTNYTIKAGGDQMHGTVFDYIRNTAFDSWGYFSKAPGANGFAVKPGEHQNSYGFSLSGPIIKGKLFYFGTYEGFHYTKISNTPQYITVPTARERAGDFTDAFGTGVGSAISPGIYDPTKPGDRGQFRGLLNGIPTYNVIPASEISSISQYLQSFLPAATNLSTVNNYLAGLPLQNDDYTLDARLDYTINARNKFSIVGVGGTHGYNVVPNYRNQIQLPFPYASGNFTSQKTASGVLTYTYVATQALINSLKYGYSRTWGLAFSPTDNSKYTAAAAGIGNLPPGSAAGTFPGIGFSGGAATAEGPPTGWASNVDSGPGGTNNYTIIDNLVWVKGRHNLTFGIQIQWLETNAAAYGGYSGGVALAYSGYSTENLTSGTGGSPYASFLVGAVYSGNVRTQTITDVGGRYHPIAPYVQDNWRFTPKLTLNLGLRYDYLQPYHEVKDRLAFVNPNVTNPITGNMGVIQFGGFGKGPNPLFAPYICQCRTPIHPYNKNWEPALGVAYNVKRDTVIRANFGVITTHAGGTGGHANATAGPGNNSEYATTTVWQGAGSTSAPVFFLNPGLGDASTGAQYDPGNQYGQPDHASIPTWFPAGNNLNPLSTTGNYTIDVNSPFNGVCGTPAAGGQQCNAQTQNYVDTYYGGRGPQFVNYNFGFEQMINKKAMLSVNYVGSQTHFLPGGSGRGPATNSISPDYAQALGSFTPPGATVAENLLTRTIGGTPLTAAELAQIHTVAPNFSPTGPYPGYSGPSATIARALSAFPQFGNLTDIWGSTGNSSYNALQVSVIQRPWHGLSGFANYTFSKSIDDTGLHRTQYPVGPQDGNFTRTYTANQIDRSLGTFDQRHAVNVTWNYNFPIGRGQAFFAGNRLATLIGGGWQLSGIYKRRGGTPLQITTQGSCLTSSDAYQGTCMPDYTPGFDRNNVRINGAWGRGPGANASNIQTIGYINPAAFQCPDANCNSFKIGNVARSAPYGLTGPGWWDVDAGLRRTFNVRDRDNLHLTFQVEADVINVTNSTFFTLAGGGGATRPCLAGQTTIQQCAALAFGTIGGQNANVPPRDWQFAGRFRF